MKQKFRSLFLAGILPVIAFTVIEEYYGTVAGLIAGMVFGVGEILWEWRTLKRVEAMTWAGNGMLLLLGGVSLFTSEGIWFKLQPALIEAVMAVGLWASVLTGRSLLVSMLQKQGGIRPDIEVRVVGLLNGMTWRIGLFFFLHALLATWAALRWSTAHWALLKGIGFTVSMILYMVVESLLLRYRIATWNRPGRS